jgi:hypothetical protein
MKRILAPVIAVVIFLVVGGLAYRLLPDKKSAPVAVETPKAIANEPVKPSVLENVPPLAINVKIKPPVVIPTPKSNSVPEPKLVVPPAPSPKPISEPVVTVGHCAIPSGAGAESVVSPTTVVGDGTALSCTAAKVADAIHNGGIVTFNCGPDALTIKVPEIKIYNNGGKGDGSVTIDGGNKITLAAAAANRIIYQNTCDESLTWTTPRCDTQSAPHLMLQNITLTGGRGSAGEGLLHKVLGGGAVYVRGGTFKAYNLKIIDSVQTNALGIVTQDLAGGAVYTFGLSKPATIVNSVFENNSGANGGAIGGLFTSYTIVNSAFSGNKATGRGMNPAKTGTTGGGLGGAIYNDGNSFALNICGSNFTNNSANELGSGSIFMVANDLNGKLSIDQSTFSSNSNNGSVQTHPSIYAEAGDKRGALGVSVTNTTGL